MRPVSTSFLSTPDGWRVELERYRDPHAHDPTREPILFVPGYGMNTFILANHPRTESMIEHLCDRGFDVWAVNLRGQGRSERVGGPRRITLNELANVDIPVAVDAVLRETEHSALVLAGCSLGASLGYAYLAHRPFSHRVSAMVGLGGPLVWEESSRLARFASRFPGVLGRVPVRKTREMAGVALSIARVFPALVSPYMNAREVNLDELSRLTPSVEDPSPYLNRQLAKWIAAGDLIVGDVHIPSALRRVEGVDLLCVFANRDGIVPPATALSVLDYFDAGSKDVIMAGHDHLKFAHADLFISDHARSIVFEPMADWLHQRCEGSS